MTNALTVTWRRLWAVLCGCVLAYCAIVPARAAAPDGSLRACVAAVRPGDRPAALFADDSRFRCDRSQASFGSGDFWVKLTDLPAWSGREDRVLRLATAWQDGLTVHVRQADGGLSSIHLDGLGWTRRMRIGASAEIALPAAGGAVTGLLLRVDGAANVDGIVPHASLVSAGVAQTEELALTALYAAFGGICLALLGHNFVMWLTLRERFQAIYCLMTVATMSYAAAVSGALARLFPDVAGNTLLRVNYLTLALAAALAVQFARHFFEAQVLDRRVCRIADLVSGGLVLAGLGFVVLAPLDVHLLDRIYLLAFVPAPLVTVAMIAFAWRRRSVLVKFYLAAWSVPVAMTAVRILHSAHLIPFSPWIDQSTLIALVWELLVSSLGIAYRIKLTNEERDRALAEEAMARQLADCDHLTGLLNRRGFLDRLTSAPRRYCLMLIDIDHFKRVNDALGHDAGDQVLRTLAVLLRGWATPEALVARLGGEEFAIALPAEADARPDVAALLAQVRRHPMTGARPVTVSVGMAQGQVAGEGDWRALYRAADAALYQAKAGGRDRVCESDPLHGIGVAA